MDRIVSVCVNMTLLHAIMILPNPDPVRRTEECDTDYTDYTALILILFGILGSMGSYVLMIFLHIRSRQTLTLTLP